VQYDAAMVLASIVLLLPILAMAGLVFLILRWLRFVPRGRAGIPAYGLIALGGYALVFLASAYQMLVSDPAMLQKKYLGQVYGTPLTLRSYEHTGFQDPNDEWIYRLAPDAVARLRQRCLPQTYDPGNCHLFYGEDERWIASAWLEGDMLHLQDGLH